MMTIYEASAAAGSRMKQDQDAKVERWLCLYLTHITPALRFQKLPREDLYLAEPVSCVRDKGEGKPVLTASNSGPCKLSHCSYKSGSRRIKCANKRLQLGPNQVLIESQYKVLKFKV